ncbi:MAG: YbdK family carboxylate-amine ligase [Microlunatus sp.]|nr:YbdK family carboxylate-amine ligase [Microlunatus sp.]
MIDPGGDPPAEPGATLGVEEEYHLLDAATYELANLPALSDAASEPLRAEMLTSQLEVASPVCHGLGEVRTAIDAMRAAAAAAAADHGALILAASTHPTAPLDRIEVAGRDRYQVLLDRFAGVVRQVNLTGCHVHVCVPDLDTAVTVMNHARPYLPVLAALCASSPFHEGVDTGWASYRLAQLALWPQGGLPPRLHGADEYLAVVGDLTRAGLITEPSELLWELRPSARYPTVEFRIADMPTDAQDVLLYAGLVRALVRTVADRATEDAPRAADAVLRAARWRAARYGLDGSLWSVAGGTLVPARVAVEEFWQLVEPDLVRHGEADLLRGLLDGLLRRGPSATRQREVYATTGDLDAVIRDELARTAGSASDPIDPHQGPFGVDRPGVDDRKTRP